MAKPSPPAALAPDLLLDRVLTLVREVWALEDPAKLPAAVLATVREGMGADWAALVPADGTAGVPSVEAGERPSGAGRSVSRTVLARLAASRDPLMVMALDEDDGDSAPASIPMEMRSVIAARMGGGTLYLESRAGRKAFTGAERVLLERLCALLDDQLGRAVAAHELKEDRDRLAALSRIDRDPGDDSLGLVGAGPAITAMRSQVRRAAEQPVTVLIRGETGTGKELVARALHRASPRAERPFVAVDCGALPEGLVESELFGHVAGAFSGAAGKRLGRFELAHKGTLFLDEVAELPPGAQAKLLRVLEERIVEPLGAERGKPVDVRLVAATHVDLQARVAEGRFRSDLYYRLAVFPLAVPPLRERKEDLPALVEHFLGGFAGRGRAKGLAPEAMAALVAHRWPGNVRELRNALEQGYVRAEGEWISAADLGLAARAPAPAGAFTLAQALASYERDLLVRTLEAERGDVGAVLRRLELSRTAFYMRCKGYGIEPADFRPAAKG